MLVVDTNVLLYAAAEGCVEHEACRSVLEELRRDPSAFYVTWGIVYEFVRVASHPKVWRKPWPAKDASGFVRALLSSRGARVLTETERHLEVAETVFGELPHLAGSLLHDSHTAVLMREHGIRRILTRDDDFRQFPFLEVLDPLGAGGR